MNGLTLESIGTLVSIAVLIFAAGYNWRRITVLEGVLDAHLAAASRRLEAIELTYARKDLMGAEMKAIGTRLDTISAQLSDLVDKSSRA